MRFTQFLAVFVLPNATSHQAIAFNARVKALVAKLTHEKKQ
jgi:hypothetical protein